MTDTVTVVLNVRIPKSTHDALLKITEAQNANLDNNVSRLLNEGIAATYARWPNLQEPRHD